MKNNTAATHKLDPAKFEFSVTSSSAPDILAKAFRRYKKWTFPDYKDGSYPPVVEATLLGLKVTVKKAYDDSYPQLDMDESYTLEIGTSEYATLTANEVWGALRGLETFSQLVYQPDINVYRTYATHIEDKPRFKHRGTLIDSSRHFLSVSTLKMHLDLMAQNKMNVFHWHLVDSESFPYPSEIFKDLSAKGAYTPRHAYTREQVQEVIKYAKNRGIRVVAEFDTPGHLGGWEPGRKGLLSKCYDREGNNNILPNIFDPSKEENFDFLKQFFNESAHTFPDNYMHFGGDEVSSSMLQCWYRNPEVRKWMENNGYGTDTYKAPNVIAHVWKGKNYAEIMSEMNSVTKAGHHAILSSCWYLNYIKYGNDWGYLENSNLRLRGMYYQCDPTDFEGTEQQKQLVLGGEATMWGEYVDGTNLIPLFWPRASAVAERLWSDPAQTKSADAAWPRLHEHRCRMLRRGFAVQTINFPNYCPVEWDPPYKDSDA
ncbi:unnamed protein product [Enterobius vermicularis]|uniref:Beta-hexosaminidase n=1 Tax=Enterobius vermicularis TaxID=51028 RepID=A0A0N4VK21_ENTVE|nr:unnamed protein product [Enterobius vermicularis]